MNFDFDISELKLDNIGAWPWSIKIVTCVSLSILIFILGYMFDTQAKSHELSAVAQQEKTLRKEFEIKQHQSASLEAYKLQLIEMKKTFGKLLLQLPSKKEVPGLLEDISKAGVASGLEFKLFDPTKERHHDFYAELPINITVVGSYHQFGDFISRIAKLSRIVTLHSFTISKNKPVTARQAQQNIQASRAKPLTMKLTAKTYRYLDSRGENK